MRGYDTRSAIRQRHGLDPDTPVGRVSTMGKDVSVSEDRTLTGIATTQEVVDLEREVVLQAGADESYFRQNKRIFVDHDYRSEMAVGKLRSVRPVLDSEVGVVSRKISIHIARSGLGDDILTTAREVGIGLSIGFQAYGWGPPTEEERAMLIKSIPSLGDGVNVVRSWLWLETSLTCFPCNIGCQIETPADDSAADGVRHLVRAGRIRGDSARMLGLVDVPDRKAVVFVDLGG